MYLLQILHFFTYPIIAAMVPTESPTDVPARLTHINFTTIPPSKMETPAKGNNFDFFYCLEAVKFYAFFFELVKMFTIVYTNWSIHFRQFFVYITEDKLQFAPGSKFCTYSLIQFPVNFSREFILHRGILGIFQIMVL